MNNLECSSAGDKRFSALYARIKAFDNKTIESLYQNAKRSEDGHIPGKGKYVHHFIWKGKTFPASKLTSFYIYLWSVYFKENPDLLEYASKFDSFTDKFKGKARNSQADAIALLVKKYRKE